MTPTEFVTDEMRALVDAGNFEPVYAALYAWLEGLSQWKTKGRIVRDFSELTAPEQNPSMFLGQGDEEAGPLLGDDTQLFKLHPEIWIYTHRGGHPDAIPGQFLNPVLGALRDALKPANPDVYTLAGLVGACRIAGTVQVFEGVLGEMTVCVVPLEITTRLE